MALSADMPVAALRLELAMREPELAAQGGGRATAKGGEAGDDKDAAVKVLDSRVIATNIIVACLFVLHNGTDQFVQAQKHADNELARSRS